jgi:CRISPR-associated protein Csd1
MLLQALSEFYARATREQLIEEPAFVKKYIRWQIPLDLDGNLQGAGLIETPETEGERGRTQRREFSVPRSSRPKNAGGVAEFLWDGIEAVFGLPPDLDAMEEDEKKRAKQQANRRAKFDDFWRQIKECYDETNSDLILALLRFKEKFQSAETPEFLRWGSLKEGEKPCWLVKAASGAEEKFKADNFTFIVRGELLTEVEDFRNFWRRAYSKEIEEKSADGETGVCLVSGRENVKISESHLPKLMSIPGASSTGAALVSFDKESFRSYGLDKSYNSPVSFEAVEAYTNALNFLVSNPKYRLRIGDTALCFWAQKTDSVGFMVADLLSEPTQDTIKNFMTRPFAGDANLEDFDKEKFYSVTIGGNSGRVVVRNWMQMTVRQAVENFRKWFQDLQIVSLMPLENYKYPPLSIYWLAVSTVREAKELRPEVPTQLYRCALGGHAPSLGISIGLLHRIAVDLAATGKKSLNNLSRFALLRLIINRNRKENEPMIEESLNTEITDEAYNCGRLLAVFEELQAAAHEYKLEGASVVERYYGTASSSPNSAFGILWRLHQHHLRKVSRSNPGKAEAIKRKIAEICANFRGLQPNEAPKFPQSFDLQAQGRFALGFYQQIAADEAAREAYYKSKKETQKAQSEQNFNGEENYE